MKEISEKLKEFLTNKLPIIVFLMALTVGLLVTGLEFSRTYDNYRFEKELRMKTLGLLLESETDSEWTTVKYESQITKNMIIADIAPGESVQSYDFAFLQKELTVHKDWANHEDECGHKRYTALFKLLRENSPNINVFKTDEKLIIFVQRGEAQFVLWADFVRT